MDQVAAGFRFAAKVSLGLVAVLVVSLSGCQSCYQCGTRCHLADDSAAGDLSQTAAETVCRIAQIQPVCFAQFEAEWPKRVAGSHRNRVRSLLCRVISRIAGRCDAWGRVAEVVFPPQRTAPTVDRLRQGNSMKPIRICQGLAVRRSWRSFVSINSSPMPR